MVIRKVLDENEEDGAESVWFLYTFSEWGQGEKSLICWEVQFGVLLCRDVKVGELKRWRVQQPASNFYINV